MSSSISGMSASLARRSSPGASFMGIMPPRAPAWRPSRFGRRSAPSSARRPVPRPSLEMILLASSSSPTNSTPAPRQAARNSLKMPRRPIPSISAWSVKTLSLSALRSDIRWPAIAESGYSGRPMSSSSVGSVLGISRVLNALPPMLGKKGCEPARVARIQQARLVVDLAAPRVALPSRRPGGPRLLAEYPGELGPRRAELRPDRGEVHPVQVVLPAVVVVAVDPDLEAGVAHPAHRVRVAPADVRGGKERAVEERPYAVDLDDARAAHLAEEAGPEDPRHGPAGLVRAEREEEAGRRAELRAVGGQVRDADPRPAVRVGIDLER